MRFLIASTIIGFLCLGCMSPEQIAEHHKQRKAELDSLIGKKITAVWEVDEGDHLIIGVEETGKIEIISHKRYFDAIIVPPK